MVTKADLLKPENLRREQTTWCDDTPVWVRSLRGDEIKLLREINAEIGNDEAAPTEHLTMAAFCIACVCDEEGNRLFDASDAEAMLAGPAAPLMRCGTLAVSLNGFSDKSQEELEKK